MAGIAGRENLYRRVNAAKKALVNEWKKEGVFKDKNNFKKSGIIPEGIGLNSLLLLLVAFKEDENVFPAQTEDGDVGVKDFIDVINTSFKKIFEWVAGGFGAAPLLNKTNASLFDENRGYTESVTWCLSASILALYAEDKLNLALEKEVHDGVLTLLGKSFKALLGAQRSDGTWGFTTDGKCCRSLYFTYIANASLADFFDYILDEINIVETANGENKAGRPMEAVVAFLNKYLNADSVAIAKEAREKLDTFLIETCLPILPKLARCEIMSEKELDALGAWITPAYPDEGAKNKKYYHNLYYTYYILDMMITANADVYFAKIANDDNMPVALLESYKPHMEQYEFDYYSSPTHFAEFFSNFYEQALHSSRMNYMSAARTGETFWDMSASELPLRWEHKDPEIQKMAKKALDQSQATLSDPTILPMALRANTVYSYYVTEKPEINIERLFVDVCNNIYTEEIDEDDDEHVKDLWDSVYYNLMITERSIESMVDFYDYLNKFDDARLTEEKSHELPPFVTVKTSFEKALDDKIAEYLRSEKGQSIIADAVTKLIGGNPTSVTTSSALDLQAVIDFVALINKKNRLQYNDDGDEFDRLMCELGNLGVKLTQCNIHKMIQEANPNSTDNYSNSQIIFKQFKDLATTVITDERLLKNKQALKLAYSFLMDR